MSDWDCSHGKANNVFQYIKNHKEKFSAEIVLRFEDIEYSLNIFGVLQQAVDHMNDERYDLAKSVLSSAAGLIYEGSTYNIVDDEDIEVTVAKFKATLDTQLEKILSDEQRDEEDN